MQSDTQFHFTSNDFSSLVNQCVHCGLCLQTCPTYRLFGLEMDSPRGRISLIRAAASGRLDVADIQGGFALHIDLCLACRACETACPSGVQYGRLIEPAKALINFYHKPGPGEILLRWVGLKHLLPHPRRLKLLAAVLRIYQVSGLQWFVRKLNFLPPNLKIMEGLIPPAIGRVRGRPSIDRSNHRARVFLFTGCIQEGFLGGINQATRNVLERNGFEVIIPEGQTCCGAAYTHLGEINQARELARRNIDAFLSQPSFEAIISNAGGCGLALKEYPHLLANDPNYYQKAIEFSKKVVDISEFLMENLSQKPTKCITTKAVYVDSCHLRHGQKVIDQPRRLISFVPGLELVELEQPDQCCGSAGVYNIAHPETANAILQSKMEDIFACEPELIITANTGCHLQMIMGVHQFKRKARVVHIMELLDMAYE